MKYPYYTTILVVTIVLVHAFIPNFEMPTIAWILYSFGVLVAGIIELARSSSIIGEKGNNGSA